MDAKVRAIRIIYREVVKLARLHDRQPHLKAMVSRKLSKQYSQTAQKWVDDQNADLHFPQASSWSNTSELTRQFLDELLQGGEYYPPVGVSMLELVRSYSRATTGVDGIEGGRESDEADAGSVLDAGIELIRLFGNNAAFARSLGAIREVDSARATVSDAPAEKPPHDSADCMHTTKHLVLQTTPCSGSLLLAHPGMSHPVFARAIVLVCEHNREGSLGLITNKPLPYSLSYGLTQETENFDAGPLASNVLFYGGPVMDGLHILHSLPDLHHEVEGRARAAETGCNGGGDNDPAQLEQRVVVEAPKTNLEQVQASSRKKQSFLRSKRVSGSDGGSNGGTCEGGAASVYYMRGQQALEAAAAYVEEGRACATDFKLVLGHSGWGVSQLEGEHASHSWLAVDSSARMSTPASSPSPTAPGAAVGADGSGCMTPSYAVDGDCDGSQDVVESGCDAEWVHQIIFGPHGTNNELQLAARNALPARVHGYRSLHEQHVPPCGTQLWGEVLTRLGGECAAFARLADMNAPIWEAEEEARRAMMGPDLDDDDDDNHGFLFLDDDDI